MLTMRLLKLIAHFNYPRYLCLKILPLFGGGSKSGWSWQPMSLWLHPLVILEPYQLHAVTLHTKCLHIYTTVGAVYYGYFKK